MGKGKGETGGSGSRRPPGLCWIQNSCQDEQDLSLYRQPVQGWSLQYEKSNTDARIIILRSDCDTVAVTADVPGGMWSSKPLFQPQTWILQRGNLLSRLLQSEPGVCYAGRVVPGGRAGCVVTLPVSWRTWAIWCLSQVLKLKLSINKEPYHKWAGFL